MGATVSMKAARPLIAAVIVAASAGFGCFAPPEVTLTNNTGGDLVVRVAAENFTTDPQRDFVVQLKQGASRTFSEGHAAIRGIQIVTANCLNRYDLPRLDDGKPGDPVLSYPVWVQIEPDLRLYLAELRGGRRGDLGKPKVIQSHGFPIRPSWAVCH